MPQSLVRQLSLAAVFIFACLPTYAGKQAEEPVADAVRVSLAAAIADKAAPRYQSRDASDAAQYKHWLKTNDARLAQRRKDLTPFARGDILETAYYEATRAGLEPAMVLGLMQVESAFRKHAVSIVGARGYMQVMPFWSRLIGDGDAGKLFHMQTNLRFGCLILRHYLDREGGDVFMALGRYNGSRGRREYPDAVLGAKKRWE